MLTDRGIQIDFVTHTVGYFQTFYQSDIQPLNSKISEERMANLRTLKYFDSLAIDLKFHFKSTQRVPLQEREQQRVWQSSP